MHPRLAGDALRFPGLALAAICLPGGLRHRGRGAVRARGLSCRRGREVLRHLSGAVDQRRGLGCFSCGVGGSCALRHVAIAAGARRRGRRRRGLGVGAADRGCFGGDCVAVVVAARPHERPHDRGTWLPPPHLLLLGARMRGRCAGGGPGVDWRRGRGQRAAVERRVAVGDARGARRTSFVAHRGRALRLVLGGGRRNAIGTEARSSFRQRCAVGLDRSWSWHRLRMRREPCRPRVLRQPRCP
mmetsp:Transcript_7986/g.22954  ORF Transcript_7986/g.22954 Transcript_7986/m.22954 type:complete len:243 (+) Transcript_7986:399-1127(+)